MHCLRSTDECNGFRRQSSGDCREPRSAHWSSGWTPYSYPQNTWKPPNRLPARHLLEAAEVTGSPLSISQRMRILAGGIFTAPSLQSLSIRNAQWLPLKKLFVDTDLVEPDNQRLSSSRQVLRLLAAFPDLVDDAFYLHWEGGPIVPEPGLCVTIPHLRTLTLEGYFPSKEFRSMPGCKKADSARVLSNVSSGLVELLHQFGPSLTRLVLT
ncbi:hypothetical protein DFP72DRAFT_891839 [Ephemerocybe angulata]|uniref:Uncharacterized protein n=1 Tax=Ephemerocybe angulata TaxID=980116 RepID=A0A8H6I4D8_9AGAR|nr:hypothetical protein DFP72DRAFT_891839 [Tulosesus angulatus]